MGKFNKKTPASVYYFINMNKEFIKRRTKNPDHTGKPGPRTPEYSQEQVAKAVSLLNQKEANFIMFHINYKDADDNDREVSAIILVFWRATKGKARGRMMEWASAVSAL